MNELLQETLVQLLSIIIGGCLAIASAYMTLFVSKLTQKAKTEALKLEDERQQTILNNTLDKVDNLLRTNIIALEETTKKVMLESISDGKVDKTELKKLAEEAKVNVINQLGEGSVSILNEGIGDLNGYISVRLEEQLAEIKKQLQ